MQFFKTRLIIIFLALTWRDEIEIIIWPYSYFETRTRLDIATLMFWDEFETSENHFSWLSEKKWSWLSSRIPGIENSRWPLAQALQWGKVSETPVMESGRWEEPPPPPLSDNCQQPKHCLGGGGRKNSQKQCFGANIHQISGKVLAETDILGFWKLNMVVQHSIHIKQLRPF